MLHLHVWGPAFGLASIDAECLAIITHLHNALPASGWRLVPSNDPSANPSNLLPALDHDGTWVSGYRPIVDYLTRKSLCANLDASLSPVQQADAVAYSAYLLASAAPLVDLSLYVSAANWAAATRPAYNALLPFPLTWTLPPLIRAEAARRAEHLGLAELDTDFDHNGGLHLTAGRDALPETFRRHLPAPTKKTVREEMTPEQAAAIRLHGLAEDCLSVVQSLLGETGPDAKPPRFFGGSHPSSLDCLAYGFLALMVVPDVPRSFLRDWIRAETPRLAVFVESMTPTDLTWAPTAAAPSLLSSTVRVADSVARNVPSLGEHYANEMRYRTEVGVKGLDQRAFVIMMSVVLTGAAVRYGLHVYKTLQPFGAGVQVWRQLRRASRLSQFGDVGIMLSSAMGPCQPGPMAAAAASPSGRLVEVDSEVD
ncbi:Mitochondrial outer membrane translocase complex, Tom37/Metaxin [Metarhizium album ARSEF 1941]|uniref:Mitochondrial outer membrane translocase complex, Tom37/Metaxin n=1 Tax=Metarhizium album (strain ARSEF 1941) TaxID=1081103 RepID=A0A0B2WSW3_METAS|nr:Mitochondrial outer membrane translocase complex, Tom37/Metaxin [Metarhizium album ARSEF 1941]KHN96704.1 Mitochondrial outer membrane translocase complex, Tom37/Metaxin [Metarhizium album ARSEF 1941]